MKFGRDTWVAGCLAGLALGLVIYWVTGPIGLAPWRIAFMTGDQNLGARARKAAGIKAPSAADDGILDKPGLPALVQMLLRAGHTQDLARPPGRVEKAFLWFLAVDVVAASALALALVRWRRENLPARRLALVLSLFALALACFLLNGQAGLRGNFLVWPSWPRLLLDVAATLAFGLSLIGLEQFFSMYPVKLEDWQVLESLRLRRGAPAGPSGRTNLISLARFIPKLITGLMLVGTVGSTLPHLLLTLRHSFETTPDGAVHTWREKIDLASLATGAYAGLFTLILIMLFGWLLATSLVAKLRAAREHCTEVERRRTDWLFAGGLVVALMVGLFSLGLLCQLLYIAWGDSAWVRLYAGGVTALFFPTGWAVMLLAMAGAVFLSETFGPKPLLKRTMLVAAAGLLISLLLAVVQHLVTANLFSHATAGLQNGFSTVLAGGLAVFSLGFFRVRMERGIDGFLNRFMPATVIADGKRRDATVMFSDLGGYTALSAADESQALLVAGHFQKAAGEVARRHGGRIVKTIGDAVMWVFTGPSDAFAAALELPREFERSTQVSKLTLLSVNSGVHHGSVVEAPGGDVYGAAVNLAARLQGAAKDGTVVASSEAVLEVSGGFRFEPMGKLELKNVPTPIACFRVLSAI